MALVGGHKGAKEQHPKAGPKANILIALPMNDGRPTRRPVAATVCKLVAVAAAAEVLTSVGTLQLRVILIPIVNRRQNSAVSRNRPLIRHQTDRRRE